MYKACWITPDATLQIIIVVLILVIAGLFCALERLNAAARHYRACFRIADETARAFKAERDDARSQLLFPDRKFL